MEHCASAKRRPFSTIPAFRVQSHAMDIYHLISFAGIFALMGLAGALSAEPRVLH